MSFRVKISLIFLLHTIRSIDCIPHLSQSETEVTFSLMNHFHSTFCVYVVADSDGKFWPARNLTDHKNYFLSVWTHNQLQDFFARTEFAEKRSEKWLVILKAEEKSFKSLREISQTASLSPLIWVMHSQGPLDKEHFQGLYIPFNCEFIYVHSRDNLHLLTEVYRIQKTSEIETTSLGFWSKDGGLVIHEQLLYRRRSNLKGYTFDAVIEVTPPYVVSHGENLSRFGGYFYEVWKEIQHRINFRAKVSQGVPNEFLVGDDDANVEFAVIPVAYDPSTLDCIDITHPIYESRSHLFGHRPGNELEWDSYLKPFDSDTWWASLAWMSCSSAALSILYKLAWNYGTSEREAQYFIFTFPESVATVFRAMCMQGSDVTPRSSACRLLFLSIYLTALVVSSAFSAALFSLLTIPMAKSPFDDFHQVINDKVFRIGLLRESSLHNTLTEFASRYPSSLQSELLRRVESMDGYPESLFDGLNDVCRHKTHILISELPQVLHAMQNLTRECQEKVMPAGPVLLRKFIGFGLKKGSPYKELIDLHLLMMRSEGVMQRLLLNNWPPQIPTVQASWVRVTLSDISPILYMFGLGAATATLFLLVEKLQFLVFCRGRPQRGKNISNKDSAVSTTFGKAFSPKITMDVKGTNQQQQKTADLRVRKLWY